MADDPPAGRRDAPAPARRRRPWFDNLAGFFGGEASSAEASRRREPAGVQLEEDAAACGHCSSSGAPHDVPPRWPRAALRPPDDWGDARGGSGGTCRAPRRRGAPHQHDSETFSRGAPAATGCGASPGASPDHLTRRDQPDRARGGGAGGGASSASLSGLFRAGRARSACTMFMALGLLLLCLVSPISAAVSYHPP